MKTLRQGVVCIAFLILYDRWPLLQGRPVRLKQPTVAQKGNWLRQ